MRQAESEASERNDHVSRNVTITVPSADAAPVPEGLVCDGQTDCVVDRHNMVPTLRRLIDEGNILRIWVKDTRGRTIVEVPVRLGEIGPVHEPLFTTLEALAGTADEFSVIVSREDALPARASIHRRE